MICTTSHAAAFAALHAPLPLPVPTAQARACRPRAPRCVSAASAAAPPAQAQAPERPWQCVQQCGACCKIGGYDLDVLQQMFPDEADRNRHAAMVGADGWCVNFDKEARNCTVYDERPWFCRVNALSFSTLYDVPEAQMDSFAAKCCTFHISDVYGVQSAEMHRFDDAVGALWDEDDDEEEEEEDGDMHDADMLDDDELGTIVGDMSDDADESDESGSDGDSLLDEVVSANDADECEDEVCPLPDFDDLPLPSEEEDSEQR